MYNKKISHILLYKKEENAKTNINSKLHEKQFLLFEVNFFSIKFMKLLLLHYLGLGLHEVSEANL